LSFHCQFADAIAIAIAIHYLIRVRYNQLL